MGQQNDKVEFEEVDEVHKKQREKIFKKPYKVVSLHQTRVCNLPDCSCQGSIHQVCPNLKICSVCDDRESRNFRKNQPLKYVDAQTSNKPKQSIYESSQNLYGKRETRVVQEPSPIYYYNAWSLPIQKCYVQRSNKALTETNFTEIEKSEESRDDRDQQSPYLPPSPKDPKDPVQAIGVIDRYDYSRVNSRDRMQNLFLFDKYDR